VRPLFVAAGWYPGRQVSTPSMSSAEHPAFSVLAEFGKLAVGRIGRGRECATSDVAFEHVQADGVEVGEWEKLLAAELVGVALAHNLHDELYVDRSGRFFGLSRIHSAFYHEGASFGEAMEHLLLGYRARPLLRPDQESVTLYGEVFTRDHPKLYTWRTSA